MRSHHNSKASPSRERTSSMSRWQVETQPAALMRQVLMKMAPLIMKETHLFTINFRRGSQSEGASRRPIDAVLPYRPKTRGRRAPDLSPQIGGCHPPDPRMPRGSAPPTPYQRGFTPMDSPGKSSSNVSCVHAQHACTTCMHARMRAYYGTSRLLAA